MVRLAFFVTASMLVGTPINAQEPLFKPSSYTSNTYSAIYMVKGCGLAQPGDQERLDYLDDWSKKHERRGAYSAQTANVDALLANPQFKAKFCQGAQAQNNAKVRAAWDEHIEMAKTYERKLASGER